MAIVPSFHDAKREAAKASIMIEGLPGKGKTGLALDIAYALIKDWQKIFMVDTENESAKLFEGITSAQGMKFEPWKHGSLTAADGFSPGNYLAYRQEAIRQHAEAVIFDSVSHAWSYKGGLLDLVSQVKASSTRYAKDSYAAWGDENVVREKTDLLELIRCLSCHMITTVRVKERFEYGTDPTTGKSTLLSMGEQQIQQGDLKYEPDLVLHMLTPGKNRGGTVVHPKALVVKSRYVIFDEGTEYEFTPALLEQLRVYLAEGVDPDVLREAQRLDYVEAMKKHLDTHPGHVPIWKMAKTDAGYADTKLDDMPMAALKALYIKITS
jgi:hypothetical protein